MKDALRHNASLPPTSDLGGVHAIWVEAINEGSCNFCTESSKTVLRVSGGSLMMRLCKSCLQSIYEQSKRGNK